MGRFCDASRALTCSERRVGHEFLPTDGAGTPSRKNEILHCTPASCGESRPTGRVGRQSSALLWTRPTRTSAQSRQTGHTSRNERTAIQLLKLLLMGMKAGFSPNRFFELGRSNPDCGDFDWRRLLSPFARPPQVSEHQTIAFFQATGSSSGSASVPCAAQADHPTPGGVQHKQKMASGRRWIWRQRRHRAQPFSWSRSLTVSSSAPWK